MLCATGNSAEYAQAMQSLLGVHSLPLGAEIRVAVEKRNYDREQQLDDKARALEQELSLDAAPMERIHTALVALPGTSCALEWLEDVRKIDSQIQHIETSELVCQPNVYRSIIIIIIIIILK